MQALGERIREKLFKICEDIKKDKIPPIQYPERPKNDEYGELFTDIAFKLAPIMKKSPNVIAEEIKKELQEFNPSVVNGFINFKIPPEISIDFLFNFTKPKNFEGQKILSEFVSANPTGPLHIGHGRIAAVGDAVSRMLEFCGGEVVREFYINDAGEQIEKLGQTIKGTGEEYKGEYTEKIKKILQDEIKNSDAFSLGFKASRIILEDIKKTLERFRVKFENFVSEKEISEKYIREALKIIKPYTYEQDSAIFLKTTLFGDDKDRVVIKRDGKPTYFGNDCAYHLYKTKRGFDILFQVWGADHHGYIKRIESFLNIAGFKGKFVVKLVQMVLLLKDGKTVQMSKREGTFITLDELIEEVGEDAARFIYLTKNSDTQLEFDIDLAKRKTMENPVFYVQYAHARISSVFEEAKTRKLISGYEKWKDNLKEKIKAKNFDEDFEFEEEERHILGLCCVFYDEVITACDLFEPSRLTSFLMSLTASFHSFYQKKKILTEDEKTRFKRFLVCEMTKKTIKTGLDLLGVSAPDKM
jgi:arginyl-tRNA synthetase